MRPSVARLVQIIPRKVIQVEERKIFLPPAPQTQDLKKPTLIDTLLQQRTKVGNHWPSNIRIEPIVKKDSLKHVQSDVRVRLKKLLKERWNGISSHVLEGIRRGWIYLFRKDDINPRYLKGFTHLHERTVSTFISYTTQIIHQPNYVTVLFSKTTGPWYTAKLSQGYFI